MNNQEIHIVLLWNSALEKKDDIVNDITTKHVILEKIEIEWSRKNFSNNMSRFYGIKLDSTKNKVNHCGVGKFLMITVLDNNPNYDFRITSRGTEYVNTNIFDLKERYRSWTGGGHKIHATNNIKETDHNLSLMLGINYADYFEKNINKHNENLYLKRDLVGANGWKSLEELFYTLNSCINYVVLRNFAGLPFSHDEKQNGDIDLLVSGLRDAQIIFGSELINNTQLLVKLEQKCIIFDLNEVDDYYSSQEWKNDILKNRVFSKNNFYIPSNEDHFFGVLYHVFIHKKQIHEKNFKPLIESYNKIFNDKINELDFDGLLLKFIEFLKKNNYYITKPNDSSVFFDTRFSIKNLNIINKVLSQQSISEISPFLVKMWKNSSGYIYFKAKDKYDRELFVKYGGIDKSAEREFFVLKSIDNKHFPKALYFRNQKDEKFVATNFIYGESLDKISFSLKSKEFKENVFKSFVSIIEVLHVKRIIHRDVRPQNLIVDAMGLVTLIDFQFVVGKGFKELKIVKQNPRIIEHLGEEYRLGHYKWDDAFSLLKISFEIDDNFKENYPNLFKMLNEKLGVCVFSSVSLKVKMLMLRRLRKNIKKRLTNFWRN